MKSLISLALILSLAVVLAAPAHAEDGDGGKKRCKGGERFAKLDKDGNGTLTSDEVPAALWSRIVKADEDGDGAVSKGEAKAAAKKRKAKKRRARKGRKGGTRGGGGSAG